MKLTKEQIKEINSKCKDEQGIFSEPFGVPDNIKEPIIYMRYNTGGYEGGSYHEDSVAEHYINYDTFREDFDVLDYVLEILKPDISYLKFKKLSKLITKSEETEYEYYGNSDDFEMTWIKLSEVEEFCLNN